MQTVIESANPLRTNAANNLVVTGAAALMGIFVATASTVPTITVYDGISASAPATILVQTFTPVAGTFYPMPFFVSRGIFVVLGGAVDCTIGWGPVSA